MKRLVVVIVVVAAGCYFDGKGNSGPPPDAPHPFATCQQIISELEVVTRDRGTCQTAADCMEVGGQREYTCNCTAILLECPGRLLAGNAPGLLRARELESEYWSRGCGALAGAPNICDCAPAYESVACSNGACVGTADSCFGPIDDASIPDAL